MHGSHARPTRRRFTGSSSPKIEVFPGSEAGSYLRLIDSCTTQLKAQGPSRTCNESKEEEAEEEVHGELHPEDRGVSWLLVFGVSNA